MVEILKQDQYQPLPVEKQILIIFAGANSYLDDIPVELCRKFEADLYKFVDNAHPELLKALREKKQIDDPLKADNIKVMDELKKQFTAEHHTTAAAAKA